MERKRKSRVISLIHRNESTGIASFLSPMITMDDAERIVEAIRLTPPDMPIDIVLHTPGGLVLATEQIARALKSHPSKITVFVPFMAMSGGTLLALAADKIQAGKNAVFGPLDPTVGFVFQAAAVIKAAKEKGAENLDDSTLIVLDTARRATEQLRALIYELIVGNVGAEKATEISTALTEGRWTHDFPLTLPKMEALGITIDTDMPLEAIRLARSGFRESVIPSVGYIPENY